jgi:hypothetical protein
MLEGTPEQIFIELSFDGKQLGNVVTLRLGSELLRQP